MKNITKQELASKMAISRGCLQKYLNKIWYDELSIKYDYRKGQRILSPKQFEFIKEKWGGF